MYAIINWNEHGLSGDPVKISERFDEVILSEEIPRNFLATTVFTEGDVAYVTLQAQESMSANIIVSGSMAERTPAVAEMLLRCKSPIPLIFSYNNNARKDGYRQVILRETNRRVKLYGYMGRIAPMQDSPIYDHRVFTDVQQILIGEGTADCMYLSASSESQSGWQKIVDAVVAAFGVKSEIKDSDEEIAKIFEDILRKRKEELQELYRKDVIREEKALKDYVEIAGLVQRTVMLMTAFEGYEANKIDLIKKEIAEVRRTHLIENVTTQDQWLCLHTDPIIAKGNKGDRLMGRMTIMVNMQNGNILLKSHDITVSRKPHPHCGEDGRPCFGTASEEIAALFAKREMGSLTQLLLAFLQQYNISDGWGARAIHWPKVVDGKIELDESEGRRIHNNQIIEGATLEEIYG